MGTQLRASAIDFDVTVRVDLRTRARENSPYLFSREERWCRAKRDRKISVPRSEKAKERDDAARSAAENFGAFPYRYQEARAVARQHKITREDLPVAINLTVTQASVPNSSGLVSSLGNFTTLSNK